MVTQTTLFISVTLTDFIYTSYFDYFLFIPVRTISVYTSQDNFCLYQSGQLLFISHTSAPVEVSVWRGGKAL